MEGNAVNQQVVTSNVETPKKTKKRSKTYEDMIIMAIKGLGEHRDGGTSIKMIKEHMITEFEVPLNTKPSSLRHFKLALEKAVTKGRIKRLTGRGLTGSIQLVNTSKSPSKQSTPKSPSKKSTPKSPRKTATPTIASPTEESPSFLDTTPPADYSSFLDTTTAAAGYDSEDNQDDERDEQEE